MNLPTTIPKESCLEANRPMNQTDYYTPEESANFGFLSCGEDVLIARNCTIIGVEKIVIGNHVRIDDFCTLYGSNGIEFKDYTWLQPTCLIFSTIINFTENRKFEPVLSKECSIVKRGRVIFQKHVTLGEGTIVMPGVHLPHGVEIGPTCLVQKTVTGWKVASGLQS